MLLAWSVQAQFPCFPGQISVAPGFEASFCDDSSAPDLIRFTSKPTAIPRAYLVVDENDVIVFIGYANTINFNGLGDNLRVYSFTVIGSITAQLGDVLGETELASGCYALSSNFIEIDSNGGQDGGILAGGPFSFCVGDGEADFLGDGAITLTGATGTNAAWVITDADGNILGLPANYTDVDFDGAGPGACLVWHLSFEDGLEGAAVGNNAADLQGCFDLSNPITVNRNQPDGGTLEGGPFTFCVGDGEADFIEDGAITLTGATGTNAAWVVTDADGNILGLPANYSDVDFDDAGDGTCLVSWLSFEDGLEGAAVGNNAASLEGCFELSNPISVERTAVNGGSVTTIDGENNVTVTVGDGLPDELEFTVAGNVGDNFTYVVTDDNNFILSVPVGNVIDFENAPVGVCRVWGLSYSGDLIAQVGDNAAGVALSSGCFSLSDAFVTVNRVDPFAPNLPHNSLSVPVVMDVQLFPNPAVDQLQVAMTSRTNKTTDVVLTVTNLNGQVLLQRKVAADQVRTTIDIAQLPAGTYFLRSNDGEQVITKRFIKS